MNKSTPNKLKGLEEEIISKYNKKIPVSEIAKEYKVSISAIYKLLKNKNQKTRDPSEEARKYVLNEDYFEIIDTEHKAYWLGFMYADGYVSSTRNDIRITIKESDVKLLQTFLYDINSTYPISHFILKSKLPNSNNTPERKMISVSLRSKKMKQDLILHGCIPKKSLVLKFPTTIPKHLIRHFIRGYIDGDGCITTSGTQKNGNKSFSLKICGTQEILNGFFDYFETLYPIKRTLYKRYNDNKNNYSIELSGNIQVKTVLDDIYKNSTIYLERKYKRYLQLQKQAVLAGNG